MGNAILVVLFAIAKIFVIVLLVLLLLILLILFVAVRYRIDSRLESRMVKGCVSWLGFVVRISFRSEGRDVKWRLHVLGIPIMSSRKKKGSKNRKRTRHRKKTEELTATESVVPEEPEQKRQSQGTDLNTNPGESGKIHADSDDKKDGVFSRLGKLRKKIGEAGRQLVTWIHTVRDAIRTVRRKAASLQDLKEILQSEHGKAFICIGKENVLHLLRQLRPRKVKGDIIFGLGDPCTTGEVLGLLSVVYAWIGTGIKVTPDFMEKRLEGRIQMWGRIRIITLICIALRIIRNKEGKKLQKEFQKWKEDF